jgi:hypothetical protein
MASVRSGQGCLTLCGEKRDLWLPTFLIDLGDDNLKRQCNKLQEQKIIKGSVTSKIASNETMYKVKTSKMNVQTATKKARLE